MGKGHRVRAEFAAAIAEDQRCRVPGVTDGLRGLGGLREFQRIKPTWDIPTIVRADTTREFDRVEHDEDFKRRFKAVLPELASFDFDKHCLFPAGGSVCAAAMFTKNKHREYQRRGDVDLFPVGHASDSAARAAIVALGNHLSAAWASHTGGQAAMRIFRTRNCITFYHPAASCTAIQVILRRYSTIGEVIHGFDLGASAFLWTGRTLYMTGMGALAATYGVNVLNLAARRGSYESRLERYFARGFDLVLPNLDIEKVAAKNTGTNLTLPYMYTYGNVKTEGSCIIVNWLSARGRPTEVSDYAPYEMSYNNPEGLDLRNIAAASSDVVNEKMLCAMSSAPATNLFEIQPEIHTHTFTAHILGMMRSTNINVVRLKRYLGTDATTLLMMNYLAKGAADEDLVTRLCEARARELKCRIALPFRFMDVQVGTALVGPFERVTVSAAVWYGELYSETPAF